ncbi:transporter [Comamonas composti]|uniref:transporter n=1 Tax=Comamonas composti TaxID=408558 RepID=UPI000401C0D7|nr:transporter [Comamonas composti]
MPIRTSPGQALAAACALCATLLCGPARAVDIDAGDYTALPAGTTLGMVYYQHATRDKLYADGEKVAVRPRLSSDIGIVRGVHFMRLGDYVIDPQFLLPFGRLSASRDIAALGSNSGVGDLTLAATLWLTEPGDKEHLGITPFIWLPTGQYERSNSLNLGENRWKAALQVGWIKPLGSRLTMDLAADVTVFGKNDDFGPGGATLKQKPQFQFQGLWRYHLSDASDLRLGLSYLNGGETRVNGQDQSDRQAATKISLGTGVFVTPKTQLVATVGRDLHVRQGFKENARINLRLLQVF